MAGLVMTIRSVLMFLILTGMFAGVSAPVSAVDLTVRFTGDFKVSTCSFTAPDTDLGTYQATTFTGATVTPFKVITVTAAGCTPDIATIHMVVSGTADSTVPTLFAVGKTSGNVTGVAIELVNRTLARLTPGVTRVDWSLATLGLTYDLGARFVQTQPNVTAGGVKTPLTIQFTYN
jgi:type 1 fimbria pilin